jgi:hypothetical protein
MIIIDLNYSVLGVVEWLKADIFDKELLQDIDKQQFLPAFEWLKADIFDKELLLDFQNRIFMPIITLLLLILAFPSSFFLYS